MIVPDPIWTVIFYIAGGIVIGAGCSIGVSYFFSYLAGMIIDAFDL